MGEITDIFKGARDSLKDFLIKLDKVDRETSASLTGYISKVSVDGTVYMEQNIVEDDIAVPLMGCLTQMYVCWILCALGLDSVCNDGRTVNERMRLVHGLQMLDDELLNKIRAGFGVGSTPAKIEVSNEASPLGDVESQVSRLATGRLVEFDFNTGAKSVTTVVNDDKSNQQKYNYSNAKDKDGNLLYPPKIAKGGKEIDGVVLEEGTPVEYGSTTTNRRSETNTTQTPGSCKAYFYVMLHPFQINKEIYNNFMQVNFVPTVSTRWRAVRAREISFWKDFVFSRDLVEREAKLLKKDKTGLVARMMARQRSGVWRWAAGMLDLIPRSNNLSNAILVFDKSTFDTSCREAHIDFNNVNQRMQFFRKTFTMMVVVVDTMYGKVDMYYAGVPQVGNYTFNMINKVGAGKNDNFDLKAIMTAFAGGNSPRF